MRSGRLRLGDGHADDLITILMNEKEAITLINILEWARDGGLSNDEEMNLAEQLETDLIETVEE